MNHLQIYKHIQANEDNQYSFELRHMMKSLNERIDTRQCQRELEILTRFINAKLADETNMEYIEGEKLNQYLLGRTIED